MAKADILMLNFGFFMLQGSDSRNAHVASICRISEPIGIQNLLHGNSGFLRTTLWSSAIALPYYEVIKHKFLNF